MNFNPLVSIVILNWNGGKYLSDCLKSVLAQSYKNVEVIFVDNCSTDKSLESTQRQYSNFIYVKNEHNVGFSKGMNIGISIAKGTYILLLNTDVFLDSDYLECCLHELESDPSVGCVAGIEYIWREGHLTNDKASSGAYGIKSHLQISDTSNISGYVFGVSGSFPIYRKILIDEIVEKTGSFFDESFETGWEDTDLRFMMVVLGWKTRCVAKTKAWHVGSASDNEQKSLYNKNPNYQIRIFRNRFFIQYKYIRYFYPLWSFFIDIVNLILPFYLLLFHAKSLEYYIKGYMAYRSQISLLKKKKKIIIEYNKSIVDLKGYILGL